MSGFDWILRFGGHCRGVIEFSASDGAVGGGPVPDLEEVGFIRAKSPAVLTWLFGHM